MFHPHTWGCDRLLSAGRFPAGDEGEAQDDGAKSGICEAGEGERGERRLTLHAGLKCRFRMLLRKTSELVIGKGEGHLSLLGDRKLN